MDKEFILAEIRRTAELNGGKPLGATRFSDLTGIRTGDWQGRYWARWSDAIREAGFTPNELQRPHNSNVLFEAYALYATELGRLPVRAELKIRRRNDSSFPSWNTFNRNGTKEGFIVQLTDFCREHPEFSSVIPWCEEYLTGKKLASPQTAGTVTGNADAYVYLAKTRRGYKIGRTEDWEQRLRQIQLHNADDVELVHLIQTDDPSGVEAYWHRRFKTKRVTTKSKTGKRRNWYNLSQTDIRAFKRWKQI